MNRKIDKLKYVFTKITVNFSILVNSELIGYLKKKCGKNKVLLKLTKSFSAAAK